MDQDVFRLRDPVGFGQAAAERVESLLAHAQCLAQHILFRGDPFATALLFVAKAKHLLCRFVEIAEQLPFPAVPYARPHRANIDDGQAQQQAQPLGALHYLHEIEDGLIVGEIALEGRGRHEQMIAHQPGYGLCLRRRQAKARAERVGDVRAQYAVVAAPTLGNVMQQHRDIEDAARQQFAHQVGSERVVGAKLSLFDAREKADSADRMFIDCIMMIHVELHLRDDAAKVGDEATKNRRFIHPAQHRFGIARRRQHVHEKAVGARVLAHLVGDKASIAAGRAHGAGVNLKPVLVGQREYLQQAHRVRLEKIVARQAQSPAIQHEPFQLLGPAEQAGDIASTLGAKLVVQMREKDGGQIAHRFGVQEIIAHEALHA